MRIIGADVTTAAELAGLFTRLEGILARVEAVLPPAPPPTDWKATAYRWR
jgi:C4-type Zn-finger protein